MPADRARIPFQRVWQGREFLLPGKNLGISKAGEARKPKKEEGKRRKKTESKKRKAKKHSVERQNKRPKFISCS